MNARLSIWAITGVFFITLSLWGCGGGGDGGSGGSLPPVKLTGTSWLIMIYSMADTDLEESMMEDLQEAMKIGSMSFDFPITVVAQADRRAGGFEETVGGIPNWTTAKRFIVKKDFLEEKQDLGEVNSGDPQTLHNFLNWAISNFPAERRVLILSDHGSSWPGFGGDDSHPDANGGPDKLTLDEIEQTLSGFSQFDIIGFDACLMANLEVAYALKDFGKILVASEEIEPGHGWDYEAILKELNKNPGMTPTALGRLIADSYKAHAEAFAQEARAEGETYNAEKEITLSVINMDRVTDLAKAVSDLAVLLKERIDADTVSLRFDWLDVAAARSKSEEYGKQPNQPSLNLVDLGHLATLINLHVFGLEVADRTDAVIATLNQAVIYNIRGVDRPQARGLSVYFPQEADQKELDYDTLDFATGFSWNEMLSSYLALEALDRTGPRWLFGTTASPPDVNGDILLSAELSSLADDTSEVYVYLTTSNVLMGMVLVEPDESGRVEVLFDGFWFSLCSRPTCVFAPFFEIDEITDTSILVAVPVVYTPVGATVGDEAVLLIKYNLNTETGQILGVWAGIEDGVAQKEVLSIQIGDKIQPHFLDLSTDKLIGGNELTIGTDGVSVQEFELPPGDYSVGFVAFDYAGNDSDAGAVALTVPLSNSPIPPPPSGLGTWTTKASMPTARDESASGVINNTLYVVGGVSSSGVYLATVEAYNYQSNTWTTKTPMPTAREGAAAGVVNNVLYIVGGWNGSPLTTVEAYDPNTDTWTSKAPMPTARYGLAIAVANNILYAIGGSNGSAVEAYNPANNTWTTKAPMPTARQFLVAEAVNNVIYAAGGFNNTGILTFPTVEALDPINNIWTTKTPMPTGRGGSAAGVVNNVLYVVGGWNSNGTLTTVEAYNPNTNTWTTKASMPTPRLYLSAGVVNNVLYAVGGRDNSGNRLAIVEAFNPP